MLRLLHIDNYKIHKHLRLELGNLTVLTGLNSSGKSSVIQSLLLLRQSYQQSVLNEGLALNGDLLSIGLCRDALCQMADEDYMSFGIDGGHGLSTWQWDASDAVMGKDFFSLLQGPDPKMLQESSLFTNNFQYISAARQEPSESYPLNTNMVESRRQLSQKYGKCELTAHFLYHYGVVKKLSVLPGLVHRAGESAELLAQVSSWERVISPDVVVTPEKGDKSYSLKYAYEIGGDTTPAYSDKCWLWIELRIADSRGTACVRERQSVADREPRSPSSRSSAVGTWHDDRASSRGGHPGYCRDPQQSCTQWHSHGF